MSKLKFVPAYTGKTSATIRLSAKEVANLLLASDNSILAKTMAALVTESIYLTDANKKFLIRQLRETATKLEKELEE